VLACYAPCGSALCCTGERVHVNSMADAAAPTLRRVAVFFDERVLAHDTGAGCFELLPSPLLEVHSQC
jgi:hypothetical protein